MKSNMKLHEAAISYYHDAPIPKGFFNGASSRRDDGNCTKMQFHITLPVVISGYIFRINCFDEPVGVTGGVGEL